MELVGWKLPDTRLRPSGAVLRAPFSAACADGVDECRDHLLGRGIELILTTFFNGTGPTGFQHVDERSSRLHIEHDPGTAAKSDGT
jgi:hypothetical protein